MPKKGEMTSIDCVSVYEREITGYYVMVLYIVYINARWGEEEI